MNKQAIYGRRSVKKTPEKKLLDKNKRMGSISIAPEDVENGDNVNVKRKESVNDFVRQTEEDILTDLVDHHESISDELYAIYIESAAGAIDLHILPLYLSSLLSSLSLAHSLLYSPPHTIYFHHSSTHFPSLPFLSCLTDMFVGGVPIDDWEDSGWAFYIITFHYLLWIFAFFYFVYTLTLTNQANKYMSLIGTTSDQGMLHVMFCPTIQSNTSVTDETNG